MFYKIAGLKRIPKNPFLNKMHRWARPRKKDNPEARLVMQIIYYLRGKGHAVGKTKTMGVVRNGRYTYDPYQFRGKCDIECFANGIMYAIEAKSNNGRQTEEQKKYQKLFHKPPHRVYILAKCLEDITNIIT